MRNCTILLLSFLVCSQTLLSQSVRLTIRDAVVWSQDQVIQGVIDTAVASTGVLYLNDSPVAFQVQRGSEGFSVPVRLREGVNSIVARVDSAAVSRYSDTLRLTLGYKLRPEIYAYATVAASSVTLHAKVFENPDSAGISFAWSEDPTNPSPVTLSNATDSVASFSLTTGSPLGEYYFDCCAAASDGDTVRSRTFVTLDTNGVRPFVIASDYAQWIDSAVIYEIRPEFFTTAGTFDGITGKIPELANLGINTIWLQPIFPGDTYVTEDYFGIRSSMGSGATLQALIRAAHSHGMHVILDIVPNHSALTHPYAQDAIQYGSQSHYFDFYQRNFDAKPYSYAYATETVGKMTFVYYSFFGSWIPNFNLDSPEVQRMIIEIGKYWIEKFDFDGYRVDATWAMIARRPEFLKQWRLALKRVKPEILLLAEDKAPSPFVFDERFDVAFDWTAEQSWVSHWVWQPYYDPATNPTIFKSTPENQRADSLRSSLTNRGNGYDSRAKILRFMENNDVAGFYETHDLARTKMVAALMFSLYGVPMLFAGQEVGRHGGFYSTSSSIQSNDRLGLYPYYRTLMTLRKTYPALVSKEFQEVRLTPSNTCFAFRRWMGHENIITVLNMASSASTVTLQVPVQNLNLDTTKTYYLSDLLTNDYFAGTAHSLASFAIPVNGYTTRILLLDTVIVTGIGEQIASTLPGEFTLEQNFPNPFNSSTNILFTLPGRSTVRLKVFDLLGRGVATLVDEDRSAGNHVVHFDAKHLPSGVYFYRLESGSYSTTKKMILMR